MIIFTPFFIIGYNIITTYGLERAMNNTYIVKRNTFLVSIIIGLHFLWSGSSYLSWLYNLIDIINVNHLSANADILSEVTGYIFQVFGMALLCVYIKKSNATFAQSSIAFSLVTIIHLFLIFPAVLTTSYSIALLTGYLVNTLIGYETAYYVIMLTEIVPGNRRALSYGLGYSIGSVGSWILSLPGNGNFLESNYVLYVYILIVLVTIGLLHLINEYEADKKLTNTTASDFNIKLITIVAIAILLLCFVKGIGFYFPMADISSGNVSLEISRAFYAIGLLLAGIINDYKRQLGAFACIAALIFPFILLCLNFAPAYSFFLWIIGYIFTGFYTVYRTIVFTDIAERTTSGLFIAPLGLLFGRLGDALGAFVGISLSSNRVPLVFSGATIFIIAIIICFFAFQALYIENVTTEQKHIMTPEEKMSNYSIYHDLSTREKEVLPLILKGHSNSEVSSILFVSENTIKFHVRNILKKTGCSNRQELVKNFNEYVSQ